jgi:branched-chain amino acid transport system substrate-binding protein
LQLIAAAIKQAGGTDGVKVREALENLKENVDGVVTTYVRPFTHDDHEAITMNMVVMGEVKGGHVVYAYDSDKATVVREKSDKK